MENSLDMPAMGIAALLNHIKIEKWAEKHELAAPLISIIDDGIAEIAPCVSRSCISEHKETAILQKNQHTALGQNGGKWVDYITTTLKTSHIFWRYVYKTSSSSSERNSADYEQLIANGCNPKLLADQSHFRTVNHSAAMLELERRLQNPSKRSGLTFY